MAANAGPNASGGSDASTRVERTTSTDARTDAGTDADTGTDAGTNAAEPGDQCPVCDVAYDSVSVHETGLMVNLLDNERYRRVCFEPVGEDAPRIRFYHHTHEQTALSV